MRRLTLYKNLAALVPSLQSVDSNKLSKHVVLDETISLLQSTNQKAAESQMVIDSLLAERQQLLTEINMWRASAGMESHAFPSSMAEVAHAEPATNTPALVAGAGDVAVLSPLQQLQGQLELPLPSSESFPDSGFLGEMGAIPQGTESLDLDGLALDPTSWQTNELCDSVVGVPDYATQPSLLMEGGT